MLEISTICLKQELEYINMKTMLFVPIFLYFILSFTYPGCTGVGFCVECRKADDYGMNRRLLAPPCGFSVCFRPINLFRPIYLILHTRWQ